MIKVRVETAFLYCVYFPVGNGTVGPFQGLSESNRNRYESSVKLNSPICPAPVLRLLYEVSFLQPAVSGCRPESESSSAGARCPVPLSQLMSSAVFYCAAKNRRNARQAPRC